MTASSTTYVCVIGFDYVPNRGKALRFEPGEDVAGMPAAKLRELATDGVITDTADTTAVDA